MTYHERLFKIIRFMHVSEKTTTKLEHSNTFVFKVEKYATKVDIKDAIGMLFSVKVCNVSTMIVAGKVKGTNKSRGIRSAWKKAYVTLEKGQTIDLINMIK